jgi:hypothetical protein
VPEFNLQSILECWSMGVMVAKEISIMQHSNTPSLQNPTIARLDDLKERENQNIEG